MGIWLFPYQFLEHGMTLLVLHQSIQLELGITGTLNDTSFLEYLEGFRL